ncbi:hypothetical protein [Croceivirga thetidis]|uniref:OmpA-like domain-containing protein n=1 Tax=Croceivirga thetidis TaxID=2721623 RepID=A0ABX1GR78_9FLAO|nr:hypothetical protein [Croceivirga thetidis]NKI32438.1 hypothetical protein [Croceivirga thetidis]
MKKILLLFSILFTLTVSAQKKSELIAQVARLQKELDSTKSVVAKAEREASSSKTFAEEKERQLKDLQAANTALLQNLNNFAEVSKRNTTNATRALETLDKKEAQINTITDVFAKNDSLAVQVVGKAKGTLGDGPQLGIGERSIGISYPVTSFFTDYKAKQLTAEGQATAERLAAFFANYPNYNIVVEGLSNTGDFDLTGAQANIIAFAINKAGVEISRISSAGRDGGFKDGFLFRMEPQFDQFYSMVKDQFKN